MANFPNTQPNLANPISTDQMNTVPHAAQHANANDEIEAIAGFVGTVGSSNPTNLISNGAMELWTAGTSVAPDGWTLSGVGATVDRWTSTNIGLYVARLTRVTNNCNISQSITGGLFPVAYWRGKSVTLGCWVYSTVATRGKIYIYDGVGSSVSAYHPGDSTWRFLTVTRVIDASATNVIAYLQVDTGDTSVYFDGAICVEGSACPSFAPDVISGTGANQLVRLNGSSQLPAVSGALLTNLPVTGGVTQVNASGSGVSFAAAEATIASVAKTITAGKTVLLIVTGWCTSTQSGASKLIRSRLKHASTTVQTVDGYTTFADSGGSGNILTMALSAIVTGLSGSVTFSITMQCVSGQAYDGHAKLQVLEF